MTDTTRLARDARLRWVTLDQCRISEVAQRELRRARVDYLVANFDLEQLGTLTVNERQPGMFYVIDGQHRLEAVKEWLGEGWEKQQIQCWAYDGLTEEEEADKFDRLNDVLTVRAYDKFMIRVTAGRALENDVVRVLATQGLVPSRMDVPGGVQAVWTVRNVYIRSDAETLGRALRIIRDAYGDAGLEAVVIDGIGHLCHRYNGTLDEDRAVTRLSNAHGGVNGLLAKAEVLRKQTGKTKGHCVAAAAVDIINSGRGGQKLPSWWKE